MLFNSFVFFLFLGVVLPVFYLLPRRYRNGFLVVASYFFYGYWDWRFCFLLALSTVVDFFVGRALFASRDDRRRRMLLLVSVCTNLGILAVFKYYGFFIDSLTPLAGIFGGRIDYLHLNVILPVGISFYTFQTMSYTIDIYRRRLEPATSFVDFALFVAFFPQLVAGPIERAGHLLPQLRERPRPTKTQVLEGVTLIVTGMFKKVMLGDTAGRFVDHIFAQPEYYRSPELLAGLVLFSVQIYADFSGYSSIARGTARLLGIELMRNFEQPYLSANITEFWRRWHISLSSWLKDYLYISLGGNRRGRVRTYVNLMLTMLLGGLWHGAGWTFVIWGGLHGIYLAVHKWMLGDRRIPDRFHYAGIGSLVVFTGKVVATYLLVLLTWLFFRAKSFSDVALFFGKMVHWEGSSLAPRLALIAAAFLSTTLLFDVLEYASGRHAFLLRLRERPVAFGIMASLALITLLYMFQGEPRPFVYFQF
jgi:D-alanyl-lipoteichoic acid acyltransferase DltB (MBOAT superfamily)